MIITALGFLGQFTLKKKPNLTVTNIFCYGELSQRKNLEPNITNELPA